MVNQKNGIWLRITNRSVYGLYLSHAGSARVLRFDSVRGSLGITACGDIMSDARQHNSSIAPIFRSRIHFAIYS